MVMTGWLPSHSIETPLDAEKAEGKAEVMHNLVVNSTNRDLVWALLQCLNAYAQRDTVINFVLPRPGTSGRDLLRAYPAIVRQLIQQKPTRLFDSAFNKDDLLGVLQETATRFRAPVGFFGKHGERIPGNEMVTKAMGDLELFVEWARRVIENIFDAVNDEDPAETVRLEAVNFDVPTDKPLRVTVVTAGEEVFNFDIPWYGRQVIQHKPVSFVMLVILSITKEIAE
jgi:hypothetical protein